jgi:hypothetical protein
MIAAALGCIGLDLRDITPPLRQGYEGPGISYLTSRSQLQQAIRAALAKRRIPENASLIVDDLTYDAVRAHPLVLPATYLIMAASVPGAPGKYAQQYHADHGVMRCNFLKGGFASAASFELLQTLSNDSPDLNHPHERNDICLFRLK